jgi:molecular chaperone IbpA
MTSNTLPKTRFIGFDHLMKELDKISSHSNDMYPPHNIIKIDEDTTIIELAVAGFSENELRIELQDNILTISGDKASKYKTAEYIHRGISTKRFSKSFRLSEYTEVTGATIAAGILTVSVSIKLPEEKLPKIISILTDKQPLGNK